MMDWHIAGMEAMSLLHNVAAGAIIKHLQEFEIDMPEIRGRDVASAVVLRNFRARRSGRRRGGMIHHDLATCLSDIRVSVWGVAHASSLSTGDRTHHHDNSSESCEISSGLGSLVAGRERDCSRTGGIEPVE